MANTVTKDAAQLAKPSERVQRTNLGTVYFISFSDIPNAKRVSELVNAEAETKKDWSKEELDGLKSMIPVFESRYKAIDGLINSSGIKQVVEIAAGRTTRGINNPQWNYVHTDQDAGALEQMQSITKMLREGKGTMPHFVKFDAITGEGLQETMGFLRHGEPVAVVHSGLFRYYPHELKAKVVANVNLFLERYGGIYVTPDILTNERWAALIKNNGPGFRKTMGKQSREMGRDLESFRFKDEKEAVEFFSKQGNNVEVYQHGDLVHHLSSVDALFSSDSERKLITDAIKSFPIFKMTLKIKRA